VFKNWWRAETGFFFGLWFSFLQLGSFQFLIDPGPYWSTVIGRQILANGQAPSAEVFSCTLHGKPWNSHQWLSQCLFALLDRLGGPDGLVLGAATLLAVLFTWVAHRLMRGGLHWLPTAGFMLLAVMAARYHLLARPHLATIALLGLTVARLADFESGRIQLRGLLWLLPIFVLWTNLHGGALGGLASIGLVFFGWLVAIVTPPPLWQRIPLRRLVVFGWLGGLASVGLVIFAWLVGFLSPPALWQRLPLKEIFIVGWLAGLFAARLFGHGLNSPLRDKRQALELIAIFAACLLATLVNPYGWQLPRDWLQLMGSPIIRNHINEHAPLEWMNPFQLPIVFFGLVYLLVILNLQSWRQLRVSWLLPLVWFVLTIDRVRHCTLFAISAAVMLAEIIPHTRAAAALAQLPSWLFQPPIESAPTDEAPAPTRHWGYNLQPYLLPAIAVLLAGVAQGMHWPVPFVGRGLAAQNQPNTPLDLLEPLEKNSKPGQPLFNDLAYGGFLIYRTNLRVFLDDRCELYGDDFLADYFSANAEYRQLKTQVEKEERQATPQEIAGLPDHLARWEKQYGVSLDLALVMKDSGFWFYLENSPRKWKKLAETDRKEFRHQAVLYQRVNR